MSNFAVDVSLAKQRHPNAEVRPADVEVDPCARALIGERCEMIRFADRINIAQSAHMNESFTTGSVNRVDPGIRANV